MTMHPVRWLHEELPKLVRVGILDQGTADRLKKHYGPAPDSPWKTGAMVLIGTLGSLLLAGGVILLFAHNWDMLTPAAKAAISIALLIVAQAAAGFVVWKRPDSAAWTEGTALFLSGAIVAAISIITQAYQITWGIETILLAWVLLTAPLIYAMKSRAAAILVWVGSTWWLFDGMWRQESLVRGLYYLALVSLVVPFMVHLNRRHGGDGRTVLLNWAGAIAFVLAAIRIGVEAGESWRVLMAGLFGLYYLFGAFRKGEQEAGALVRNTFRSIGALGLGVLIFLFSFREQWADSLGPVDSAGRITVFLIGMTMCGVAVFYGARLLREGRHHQAALMLVPALAIVGTVAQRLDDYPSIMAILANLAVLTIGLTVCVHGFRNGRLGTVNGGLILLIAVFLARFFDFDLSFLTRGVAFIVVGAGFLALNGWLYRRARQEGVS